MPASLNLQPPPSPSAGRTFLANPFETHLFQSHHWCPQPSIGRANSSEQPTRMPPPNHQTHRLAQKLCHRVCLRVSCSFCNVDALPGLQTTSSAAPSVSPPPRHTHLPFQGSLPSARSALTPPARSTSVPSLSRPHGHWEGKACAFPFFSFLTPSPVTPSTVPRPSSPSVSECLLPEGKAHSETDPNTGISPTLLHGDSDQAARSMPHVARGEPDHHKSQLSLHESLQSEKGGCS